jgi:hypothetical protein
MKIARSPDRNTFQRDKYFERQADKGLTPDNDETTKFMVDYYSSINEIEKSRESDPNWQVDNLEYDLRTTQWIVDKVKSSDQYAQNLYAALCNNDFQRAEVWPILTDKFWSCSWRYAGGIVANMREEGDYINWYCSGIGDGLGNGDSDGTKGYVGESVVTDEIKDDLAKLGWIVITQTSE